MFYVETNRAQITICSHSFLFLFFPWIKRKIVSRIDRTRVRVSQSLDLTMSCDKFLNLLLTVKTSTNTNTTILWLRKRIAIVIGQEHFDLWWHKWWMTNNERNGVVDGASLPLVAKRWATTNQQRPSDNWHQNPRNGPQLRKAKV